MSVLAYLVRWGVELRFKGLGVVHFYVNCTVTFW